jgi:hypothetical protein
LLWKQSSRPQFHFDCLDIGQGYSHVAYTYMCKVRAKSDNNWQFWKIDLDLKNFDLQRLERSLNQGQMWPIYVIVSRIRNILVPVGNLYDDWFKSYAHICKTLVSICVTLTLVRFLPNLWYAICSTRWNKCKKTGIISKSYLMLWWYECWCYWQIMPYPL